MAKVDRADAYKQLPVASKGELAAAATGGRTVDGMWYGFIPHTPLFGSAAAVLRYNCLSRVIASLICRAPEIPRKGFFDDFGMVLRECLIKTALNISASFNRALLIILRGKKYEFGAFLEPLGLTVRLLSDGGQTIASLSLVAEKLQKLATTNRELAGQKAASFAHLRK